MKEFSRDNTDEIICPYCDYEFSDSWDYIPNDASGETCWKEECPECEKEFDVTFDGHNVNNGYSTKIPKCKDGECDFRLHDSLYKSSFRDEISIYSRIDTCAICNEYKFTPVKEDGSDFTGEEIRAFKLKKRLEKKPRLHFPFNGVKTGEFSFNGEGNMKISLSLKEPEGNVQIWTKIARWMRSKGFVAQMLPDFLRKNSIELKRDWVECTISLANFAINVEFYQNVVMDSRKPGDGRYEYNKYKILPPEMKLRIRSEINSIKKYLLSEGFSFKRELTAEERILERTGVSSLSEWKDPESGMERDRMDSNGVRMKSGDLKYFYDGKILKRGIVWWNNGNQWYVMCNGILKQASHFYLFDYNGEPERKPLSKDAQIQRLHTELTRAEKLHDYDKCKSLWKLLQSYKLYNVWSIKHGSWWGKNNAGYTDDKDLAGVYTHDAIIAKQSYYNDGVDSVAKEIS